MAKRPEGYKRPPGPDPKARWVHYLQYAIIRILESVVMVMPMSWVQGLGSFLGRVIHLLDRKHRNIALVNTQLIFGNRRSGKAKKTIVRDCYRHLGRALLETIRLRRVNASNFRDWVELDGVENFHRGLEKGCGVILCTAHYGNWELMNAVLGLLDLPMSVLARPLDNPLVHEHVKAIRTRTGNRVIDKSKSVRKILTSLRENRIVGFVNDQNVHDHNRIMVPFFGHDAATTPVPGALAIKTGAPIVTGYSVPLGGGRYRLVFHEPIEAQPGAEKEQETLRLARLLNDRLEAQIEEVPHCWFWVHRRFKTGAEGENDYYSKGPVIG